MKRGFTLVELLAVLVLIAALSLIAVPSIINYINQSGSEIDGTTKSIIANGSQLYVDANKNNYPEIEGNRYCLSVQTLVDENYLDSEIVDAKGNDLNEKFVQIDYVYAYDLGANKYVYDVVDACNAGLVNTSFNENFASYEETTASISTANMNINNKDIVGYKIYGNNNIISISPSPTSPVNIINLGHNGYINIKTIGKNLMPKRTSLVTSVGVTVTYDDTDNTFVLNGTTTSQGNIEILPRYTKIGINTNKAYTLRVSEVGGTATLASGTGITYAYSIFNDSNNIYMRGTTSNASFQNYSFSSQGISTTNGYRVYLQCWRVGTVFENYKIRIQLEEGSSATDFEPYKESTSVISLTGHDPLRCVNGVCDYIDYANKRVVRNVGKIVFNGTESWSTESTNNFYTSNPINNAKASVTVLCTHFPSVTASLQSGNNIFISSTGKLNIQTSAIAHDSSSFKTWLSNNNVTVYYQLANPTFEDIELANISTYDGITNLSIGDETLMPYKIELRLRNKRA